jgi:anti-sigma regulatory factor (Ser/Thr protein kinase)
LRELSLHIMDIIENGIAAGANRIGLKIIEDKEHNLLTITIADNGKGISQEMLEKVMDPFFTTRTTRRVGLGLSLFRQASKQCAGEFHIQSAEGKGTEVSASFRMDHIDLVPLGDMAASMTCLIMGNADVDFEYTHEANGRSFHLDTGRIRDELEGVPFNHPNVIRYIERMIRESLEELKQDQEETPCRN